MSQYADLIKKNEGCKLELYQCTENKTTIGWGTNLEDRGITQAEANFMLDTDLQACELDLKEFKFFLDLATARRCVLMDMRYQLGAQGFRGFKKMIAALYDRDYQEAATQMLDSKYANQTPNRALVNAKVMERGKF